jgi:chemotaxis protein MotB
MNSAKPIIIIKRKGGHGGHHGGAWKVAYADFVTAMMALFIVLWLMNSSKKIQEAVGGYFRDPMGTSKAAGNSLVGLEESLSLVRENMPQLKEQLQKSMQQLSNFDNLKSQIEMTVTAEGLRIELLESQTGVFFDSGSAEPNNNGREMLVMLTQQLKELPNKISLEGHTDAKPYVGKSHYGNWELSADRANAARRIMQENGLRADQVSQVRGYADQKPRKPEDTLDPSNRRISLIVQYLPKDDSESENPAGGVAEPGPAKNESTQH